MELILTVMAEDRPGIAERLASTIETNSGNWLESRMATMAGKFAGIIRVDVDVASAEALKAALNALDSEGLKVQIEAGETADAELNRFCFEVVGNDRPGIVREVTNALASVGANVIDLNTIIEPASMSGGELFKASIEIALTPEQNMDDVVHALENLSPDLMVDRP